MKFIMKKQTTSMVLLLIALNGYTYAESAPSLPISSQITKESNESLEVKIVPEIIIQTGEDNENRNSNLKEGEACDDQALDSAVLFPDEYQDIPMAKTIPCDKVNCEGLKAARLMKDSYRKLPMAKTTKLKPCVKK